MLTKVKTVLKKILNPPHHTHYKTDFENKAACLEALEHLSGLPEGDLYLSDEPPMDVVAAPRDWSKVYGVKSKTSELWSKDGSMEGYICGTLLKSSKDNEIIFYGDLHVSKNCPGVFRDRVCTSCGHVD